MNAIKLTGIVAAGALLASSAAFAEGPKWTYLEGAFTQSDEVGDDDENNFTSIGGSFGFADMYHLQAVYGQGNLVDEDYDGYAIIAGVNPAVTDVTDFVAQISYFDNSADDFDLDQDGYGVRMGLRSMYTDKVELSAYGVYIDSSFDSDVIDLSEFGLDDVTTVGAQIGGQYYWTEAFSVGMEATLADSNALRFNARWSFY